MIYEFFNEWHLGDCLFTCLYLSKVAKARTDCQFVFDCGFHDQLRETVEHVPNIRLAPLNARTKAAYNAWIGTKEFWHNSPIRNDILRFYLEWFRHLSEITGLPSLFRSTEDLWFDFPSIRKETKLSRPFDVLVVNGRPGSGQFPYDQGQMNDLIRSLSNKGYKVVCTSPCGVSGVECTMNHGITVSGIGNISNLCPIHVMISTGPTWMTFNPWGRSAVKKRIILLKEIRMNYPGVVHCDTMRIAIRTLTSEGIL